MKPPAQETKSEYQREWWSSPGVVYFFAAGNPPTAIKIGVTAISKRTNLVSAVIQRFRAIQTHNHELVELLGVVHFNTGDMPTREAEILERELHIRYTHLQRFKPHTRGAEWFIASDDLLTYISKNAKTPEELGLPRIIADIQTCPKESDA